MLAALFCGWTAAALPFYPGGWPFGLALVAAVLSLLSARGGLAFALAVPILPLGNISFGLALLYAGVAAAWFALHLREPSAGLAFVLGPLLAPLSALGLVPLLVQPVRSTWRRALGAGTAVLAAAIVAGVENDPLPFGSKAFAPLRIQEGRSPFHVAAAMRHALVTHPAIALEAIVLAVAAAAIPLARRFGLWGLAGYGAATIAAGVLVAPHADPVPIVLTTWGTCVGVALWDTRHAWIPRARPLFAGLSSN